MWRATLFLAVLWLTACSSPIEFKTPAELDSNASENTETQPNDSTDRPNEGSAILPPSQGDQP